MLIFGLILLIPQIIFSAIIVVLANKNKRKTALMIHCPNCNASISDMVRECPECNKKLALCLQCGDTVLGLADICSKCGHTFGQVSVSFKDALRETGYDTYSHFLYSVPKLKKYIQKMDFVKVVKIFIVFTIYIWIMSIILKANVPYNIINDGTLACAGFVLYILAFIIFIWYVPKIGYSGLWIVLMGVTSIIFLGNIFLFLIGLAISVSREYPKKELKV